MGPTPSHEPAPLHLVFSLGTDRYALLASAVREVLPLQRLKQIPEAPPWVAGLLSYRGQIVPVLDLCQRVLGRAARQSINTRLVLTQYTPEKMLGLLLEQTNQVLRLPLHTQQPMGLDTGGAYLGSIQAQNSGDLIQRITVAGLLPPDVADLLFPAEDKLP